MDRLLRSLKKYSGLIIFGIALILMVIVLASYLPNNNFQPLSQFDVSPSPASSQEPEITAWRIYNSDQYYFSIEVPAEWHMEDYAAVHPNGGTLVAFSPDPLPCKTCTYFRDGYFSVRVYNQNSHPEFYQAFSQRMKSIGQVQGYQPITLDQKPGVLFANTAAVEHQGWVYELSLDKNKGDASPAESQLFQKVLASFKLNSLLFSN